MDMAARHRARFRSIQIIKVSELKTDQIRRPYIQQLIVGLRVTATSVLIIFSSPVGS